MEESIKFVTFKFANKKANKMFTLFNNMPSVQFTTHHAKFVFTAVNHVADLLGNKAIFQRGQQVTFLVHDWRVSIHFAFSAFG